MKSLRIMPDERNEERQFVEARRLIAEGVMRAISRPAGETDSAPGYRPANQTPDFVDCANWTDTGPTDVEITNHYA